MKLLFSYEVWTKQLPSVLTWLKVNQKPKVWVEDVLLGTKENNNPVKQLQRIC